MGSPELSAMRHEYSTGGLAEADAGDDPFALFDRWLSEAVRAGLSEPNAMALATSTPDGLPSVRLVLLKSIDGRGAVFHTNYLSRKGLEVTANPHAAAVLLWHELARQVRIEGAVETLDPEESDRYFRTRPEGGRISAAASPQSQVVADRSELERRWRLAASSPRAGERPDHWGGLRIVIDSFEFWQGRPDRLHDRLRYRRDGSRWARERLAP